jgi:pyridoxamine 5'-phosphate oxidase
VSDPPEPAGAPAGQRTLDEGTIGPNWLSQFQQWLEEAVAAGLAEPTAMVLATADARARPSARMVLMKGLDERGFVFYSNRTSHKGADLAANARASLVFPWHAMRRQVIVDGGVQVLDEQSSDEYFATRPYGSQLGAHASRQSTVIASRAVLDAARSRAEASYPPGTRVPRPDRWGGWRVEPDTVEFWQGRSDRLHDRLRFRREQGERWVLERLSP